MKNVNLILLSVILASGISLQGCKKKSTDTELEGTWTAACKDGGDGSSSQQSLEFDGSAVTINFSMYADAACTTSLLSVEIAGTFDIGADSTVVTGATVLDITIATFKITPQSADGATFLNTSTICGLTNYASGTTSDVTGLDCTGFTGTISAGDTMLTIYQIDGTSLTLGDGGDQGGFTNSVRHTALDDDILTKE